MTESSFPWNGKASAGAPGDTGGYSATTQARINAAMLGNRTGVLDGLAVVEASPQSKAVTLRLGQAIVRGVIYLLDANLTVSIDDNASGNPRIDRVVLECDWTAQTVRAQIVNGAPASSPSPPSLTQNDGVLWQMPLAQVTVADGFMTITNADIARERVWARPDPPGLLAPWAGSLTDAPAGWLGCYGQAVSRSDYVDLYDTIGTSYGAGDGSTTFNVPDLRGRVWAGLDNMGGSSANRVTDADADTLGGTHGAETHTLTTSQVPNLSIRARSNSAIGAEAYAMRTAFGGTYEPISTADGGGGAHNNVQPTMFGGWIIKT